MNNSLTRKEIELALNEWLRRFTENPSEFEHQWETVARFLKEDENGQDSSYGEVGATFMFEIISDLRGNM